MRWYEIIFWGAMIICGIYLVTRIQAKAFFDTFDKYLDQKLNSYHKFINSKSKDHGKTKEK